MLWLKGSVFNAIILWKLLHTWSQCGSWADARWCSQGLAINNIASNAWGEEMYHSRSGYTWILLPVTLTYPTSSHPLSFLTSLDYFHLIVENVFQALLPLYKNNSDRMTERGYKLCEHRRIKCERGAGSGIVKWGTLLIYSRDDAAPSGFIRIKNPAQPGSGIRM